MITRLMNIMVQKGNQRVSCEGQAGELPRTKAKPMQRTYKERRQTKSHRSICFIPVHFFWAPVHTSGCMFGAPVGVTQDTPPRAVSPAVLAFNPGKGTAVPSLFAVYTSLHGHGRKQKQQKKVTGKEAHCTFVDPTVGGGARDLEREAAAGWGRQSLTATVAVTTDRGRPGRLQRRRRRRWRGRERPLAMAVAVVVAGAAGPEQVRKGVLVVLTPLPVAAGEAAIETTVLPAAASLPRSLSLFPPRSRRFRKGQGRGRPTQAVAAATAIFVVVLLDGCFARRCRCRCLRRCHVRAARSSVVVTAAVAVAATAAAAPPAVLLLVRGRIFHRVPTVLLYARRGRRRGVRQRAWKRLVPRGVASRAMVRITGLCAPPTRLNRNNKEGPKHQPRTCACFPRPHPEKLPANAPEKTRPAGRASVPTNTTLTPSRAPHTHVLAHTHRIALLPSAAAVCGSDCATTTATATRPPAYCCRCCYPCCCCCCYCCRGRLRHPRHPGRLIRRSRAGPWR